MFNRILIIQLCFAALLFASCTKSRFLDAKPNERIIVPSTISDFRLLLDNANIMNGYGIGLVPGIGEASADDYYVNETLFNSDLTSSLVHRQLYTWQDGIFNNPSEKPEDWSFPYRCIFYSNVVINELPKTSPSPKQQLEYNELLGAAYFFRAHMYYQLSQIFSPVVDEKSSKGNEYGVLIKLSADINEKLSRAKVLEVYKLIIDDLQKSTDLLPDTVTYNTRPSKGAAFGLLARVYLMMGNYSKSLENAEKCLTINNKLLDYNNVSPSKFYPFVRTNQEVIFYSLLNYQFLDLLNLYYSRIDSSLYNSYSDSDLRKRLFFMNAYDVFGVPDDTGFFFRGSYDGSDKLFAGIATNEIYFISSECKARLNRIDEAMNDLNHILKFRWDNTISYIPYNTNNQEEALSIILQERRKELLMRGLRWGDIRRLNRDGANISIKRTLSGNTYSLEPQSLHFTILIPNDVIGVNSGILQNPR